MFGRWFEIINLLMCNLKATCCRIKVLAAFKRANREHLFFWIFFFFFFFFVFNDDPPMRGVEGRGGG